jgi:hypothetical protein
MEPVGWSTDEFKLIDTDDDEDEDEDEDEDDDNPQVTKGYSKDADKYKKILSEDELLPE